MEQLKHNWKRVPKAVRLPLVLVIGSAVTIVGLIMLPLPGPGWPIIFLGIAILATEFAAAEKLRDWLIGLVKRLFANAKDSFKK